MSTYVKYVANIINWAFGVPFGAAQLVAGLHVFWLVLCFGLIRKLGTGTIAGILKGVIELFTGNPHGITVVLISGVEGVFLDLGMASFRKKHAIYSYGISAGFAAAAEVFVFYPLFFPSLPLWFMFATSLIAFGSGFVFGGFFGTGTLELLHESKVARIPDWKPKVVYNHNPQPLSAPKKTERRRIKLLRNPFYIASFLFILFFAIGGMAYFLTVPSLFQDTTTCTVEGAVENPYTYNPEDFKDESLTIRAQLRGQVTFESEKDYTGVPLHIIVNHSKPNEHISKIEIIASDLYNTTFDWAKVQEDNELILIKENDSLRLIAANYDGAYWVRNVVRIVVT